MVGKYNNCRGFSLGTFQTLLVDIRKKAYSDKLNALIFHGFGIIFYFNPRIAPITMSLTCLSGSRVFIS